MYLHSDPNGYLLPWAERIIQTQTSRWSVSKRFLFSILQRKSGRTKQLQGAHPPVGYILAPRVLTLQVQIMKCKRRSSGGIQIELIHSFRIVHGGWTGTFGAPSIPFDTIHILTLPAFHWIQVSYTTTSPRTGLTCNAVGASQILTIGGSDPNAPGVFCNWLLWFPRADLPDSRSEPAGFGDI